MKTIGNNIRKIRKIRELTLEIMAFELGIAPSTYSRRESGQVKIDIDMLEKIAKILNVTVEIILHFHEKNLLD